MTLANFKSLVLAYVNRDSASLTSVNSQDILLGAINDARRAAQRMHDFELCKTEDAYLTTHAGGALWTTGCKTTPGGGTAIEMKRVDEVWNYSSNVIGATTYYPRSTRVDYSYSGRFKRELSTSGNPRYDQTVQDAVNEKFAYTTGPRLFVTTVNTATHFKLVGIQWLSDLADGDSPDIFLTYFTDWLKYATIAALNTYLPASERFAIDAAILDGLWNGVKFHDGNIANMGEAISGD